METKPPRHILWSTDQLDTNDPFQRLWLLRQTLTHGRAEDIRKLDFDEIEKHLNDLNLPPEIDSLWRTYFQEKYGNK